MGYVISRGVSHWTALADLDVLAEDVAPPGTRVPAPLARLDPDGTAVGKTILTAPVECSSEGTMSISPGQTHVDLETGKRTPLLAVEKGSPPTHAPRERARTARKPRRAASRGSTPQRGA